ncbi:MAG: DUF1365 domain-containing protein [Gammaproteobacteria bacterium]
MIGLNAYLCSGRLYHHRIKPKTHRFGYRTMMLYADLEHIEQIIQSLHYISYNRWNIASIHEKDHLTDKTLTLRAHILALVAQKFNTNTAYRISLLTQLAHWGFCFNPISIFVCQHPQNHNIDYLVVEVRNTPWLERHYYVLANQQTSTLRSTSFIAHFNKEMHVSPFLPLDMQYHIKLIINHPNIRLHVTNKHNQQRYFSAGLSMLSMPLTQVNLNKHLKQYLFNAQKVTAGIYWQAFKLWLKRFKFYHHPHNRQGSWS